MSSLLKKYKCCLGKKIQKVFIFLFVKLSNADLSYLNSLKTKSYLNEITKNEYMLYERVII